MPVPVSPIPVLTFSHTLSVAPFSSGSDDPNADLKSPISLVHEIGLKRSLSVGFTVTRETGPPHMRTFLTQCFCGDISTDGEGSSKKVRTVG